MDLFNRFRVYHKNVNWFVFLFISLFTIGSWIDINGMWCELPIMVHELPEGWRLPSILGIITQVSQIAPIVFLVLKWRFPKYVSFSTTIYVILSIGALSCLLLSFFWSKTLNIAGENRSVGLYSLTLTLSILDGTSSVTFLQYIAENFKKEYIIPNYIGESLSAMIPSVFGIIQGVGQDLGCRNVTKKDNYSGHTELEPIPLVPYFSVSNYYIILFVLLSISVIAFTLLSFLPLSKTARKKDLITIVPKSDDFNDYTKTEINDNQISSTASIIQKDNYNDNYLISTTKKVATPTRNEQIILLGLVFSVSFIAYGVLPGLQSYSTIPYGNDIFHLAINLSFIFMPIVIFLSIWSYNVSTIRIVIEFLIGIAFSIYIVVIAVLSPCPPINNWFGSTIIVISWVATQNIFMRVRCCVAARLEECGQKVLLILGGCTVAGQILGGLISFLCIDTYRLLEDLPPCVTALEFCGINRK